MSAGQGGGGVCAGGPPALAYRVVDGRREAYLVASGLAIWQVVAALAAGDRPAGNDPRFDTLPEEQIRLALAYYERHPQEIDQALTQAR